MAHKESGSSTLAELAAFVTVTSDFYPDRGPHYRALIEAWVNERARSLVTFKHPRSWPQLVIAPRVERRTSDIAAAPLTTSRFAFTGRAGPYFRIWIVSLFLSIITLGIYSAWGKVRKKRYLYAHTRLDGTGFEFRASPIAILKGRAIALLLFGGFALSGHIFPVMQLAFVLLLLILLPWIVVAAARFNARNSAWRNIVFSFDGSFGEAAKVFLGFGALALVTLGLGYPYFKMRRARFIIEHHSFGTTHFRADLATGGFIITYGFAFLMSLGIVLMFSFVMFVTAAAAAGGSSHTKPSGFTVFVLMILLYAAYIAVFAYVRAQVGNLTFNGVVAGVLRCRSTLRTRDLVWLYLSNIVAILATLGLAIAWVTVRMARYRAANLYLIGEGTPETFTGATTRGSSATGSEVSDLFDVDVSL